MNRSRETAAATALQYNLWGVKLRAPRTEGGLLRSACQGPAVCKRRMEAPVWEASRQLCTRKTARRQHEGRGLGGARREARAGRGSRFLATLIDDSIGCLLGNTRPARGHSGWVGRLARGRAGGRRLASAGRPARGSNLVDPASSHTLVSKIKPCTSK